ncbi:hypothetical protein [Cupriavidus sp.]|uniref:hypothetical protein n=1 Tax=Cupriavidus sp. TaxID=1873897 RepID=UPI0025C4F848|nr:hypothetical protein [Cupriavidus sp.]MCA3196410.1 hypothetical protein [Cupriavidus sp.]MCA3202155.1 hypothetical protein [Cupriavidus sp.]MCA3232189.1 hypothetical protein [Cupriavidus sp.]
MKISLGNFGNTVARPSPSINVPDTGSAIAQGAARLGAAVGDIGTQMQANAEAQRRADSALSLAQFDNDVRDAHDTVDRQLQSGELKAADAISAYRKQVQDLQSQRFEGMDPETRRLIEPNIVRTTGALERNLQGSVVKRQQSEIGASLDGLGEQFQRNAMRDLPGSIANYHNAVDQLGPQAGLTPEQMAQKKQAFTEGATYNFANATLEGAAQTGNADLVKAAMDKIGGQEGEALDPAKRTALMTKGYGYLNGIEAAGIRAQEKAEREAKAREEKAKDAVNAATDIVLRGKYLDMDTINGLAETTAGTAYATQAQQLVQDQGEAARFATMPSAQRKALLEAENAKAVTKGQGISPQRQKQLDQLGRIDSNIDSAVKENPWQAAQESGVVTRAPAISIGNVQDAQQIIGMRMQQIGQVEQWSGKKESPLQPDEARTLGKLVQSLPPDQAASALGSIGGLVKDMDRVSALAKQLGGDNNVLSNAMAYANAQTSVGRYTAELVLRGQQAMKDGTAKVDSAKETGWKAEIAQKINGLTMNQDTSRAWKDSAFMIMAGLVAEGKSPDADQAVNLATGGVREQRDGTKIPRPYGMSDDTFTQRIAGITPSDLAQQAPGGDVFSGKTAIPLDRFIQQLPQASLVHAGPGRYAIRAGQGFVTNSAGQRITIDLNPSRPTAAPPNGAQGMPARSAQ